MKDRVLRFIERTSAGDLDPRIHEGEFVRLALDVFAWQFDHVAAYRRFCEARGVRPGHVDSLAEIPAMPTDAFKGPLLPPEEIGEAGCIFESSGTTRGKERRSRHALRDTDTYRASALRWFDAMVLPDRPGTMTTLVLGPTAATHPRSSLGRMFSWCMEEHAMETLAAFDAEGRLDLDRAIDFLAATARGSKPVLILAVTSALTALFHELRHRDLALRLPADSRIVDTGGRKGGPTLSSRAILKAAWTRLHVPAWACINEYGMTEMLSQFYDDCLRTRVDGGLAPRVKVGPPWCRTRILDPSDLSERAEGEAGLLAHFDLANWDSVSSLLTLDWGRKNGRGFEMLGRAPMAEARGCSQLLAEVGAPEGAGSW
jgi:hypothetical protein